MSTRTYPSVYVYLLKWVPRTYSREYVVLVFVVLPSKSPNGAILLHSPGRKPWVNRSPHLLSPVGAAQPQRKANTRAVSAAPTELILHLVRVSPRFHIGLCPHSTLGYARVSSLKELIMRLNFDALAPFSELHLKKKCRIFITFVFALLTITQFSY